jgi:membrane-bound lytic murein transglycosylase D
MPVVVTKTTRIFSTLMVVMTVFALLPSCASLNAAKTDAGGETGSAMVAKNDAVAQELAANSAPQSDKPEKTALTESKTKSADDIENLTIGDVIRIEEPNTANLYDNSRYDFPITVNSKVEGWIDYFTGRGRHHMERYLGRSSRYMPSMKEILKKNGLPEDLVFLALIESGFNMRARSRARAVGPWQFIKPTGKRYGLRVDSWIDERRDWIRSTEAAAKYLKDLYLMFESWYLAASAYNAGEYKILRAIEQVKSHNFWRISQTKAIRRETKDYVPKLIAAAIIAKNPAKYGFEDVTFEQPLEFEVVNIDFSVSLATIAKMIDAPEDDLLDLNPELAHGVIPPSAGITDIRVPIGTRVVVERALASLKGSGENVGAMPLQHVVRRGDTFQSVANRYRIRKGDLAAANNMSPKEKLVPGSALVIPNRTVSSAARSTSSVVRKAAATESITEDGGAFRIHVVRRGESLWSISEKYRVSIPDLYRWNKLNNASKIMPGRKIKIKSERDSKGETAVFSAGRTDSRENPS